MSWVPSRYKGVSGVERGERAGSRRQIMPPMTLVSVGEEVQRMVREKEMGVVGERMVL